MTTSYRNQIGVKDTVEILALLSIPALLAAVYFLTPTSFQLSLALDHTNPVLHTFWTNSFVHEHQPDDAHLFGNLVGYTILVFPCWLLYKFRDQNRRFWIGFLLILLVGPVVVSSTSYLVFNESTHLQIQYDRGFSGVVGALDGFLILSILRTFESEQEEPVGLLSIGVYCSCLFLGLGVVTARVSVVSMGGLLLAGVFAATRTDYVASPSKLSSWGVSNRRLSGVILFAAVASVLVFASALPANIVNETGGWTNIVAHGAGIVFGMCVEVASQIRDSFF
ncbi:hypothetical protein [Haladaptatus sp. ZSTT2]|uniref:hypothetical protein n=1 Tax=Haladaptatus sp. ZSTT2 TaxID=3120515 RepID=UPI00300EBAED